MAHLTELTQANELVQGMTISQRLDTALHLMTAKARCIEDVNDSEVIYFFDDCESWTFTAIVDIEDGRYGFISTLKDLHFNDEPTECDDKQRAAIEQLVADEYADTLPSDEPYESHCDQATYGFTNSDWLAA